MRKILLPLLMGSLAFVVSSCSNSAAYVNAIPENSDMVISINVGSMLSKSGVADNQEVKDLVLEAAESEVDKSIYSYLESILDDVNKSGIDFAAPIYVSMDVENMEQPFIVLKTSEVSDLEKGLKMMVNEGIFGEINSDSEAFSYTVGGNEDAVLAFNEDVIIITSIPYGTTSEEIANDVISKLIAQDGTSGVAQEDGFKKITSADIGMYADYAEVIKSTGVDFTDTYKTFGVESFEDISAYGTINFEKGKIVTKCAIDSENEEFNELMEKYMACYGNVSGKYLKNIPQSSIGTAIICFEGEKFAEIVEEIAEMDSDFSMTEQQMAGFKDVLSLFTGDIATTIIDENNMALLAEVSSDDDALEAIHACEDMFGMKFTTSGKNDFNFYNTVFFGVDDNTFYATNNSMVASDPMGKAKKSLADVDFETSLDNKFMFVYFDTNAAAFKSLVKRQMGNEPALAYTLDEISHVEMSGNRDAEVEMVIVLKNDEENSLKVFADAAQKLASSFL